MALKTDLLKIKIPMHTRRLTSICDRLQSFLEGGVGVKRPVVALYAPMLGRRVGNEEDALGVLSMQISLPSLFGPTLKAMSETGLKRFVEVGPGDVLTKLVRWNVRDATVPGGALEDPASIDAFAKELAPPPLFSFEEKSTRGSAGALQDLRGSESK